MSNVSDSAAIDPIARLGDLAAKRSDLLSAMDSLGLDYCCHGADTISEAAARARVSVADVLAAFASTSSAPSPRPTSVCDVDAALLSMSALCDHIEQAHHACVRRTFADLDVLVPNVAEHHGVHTPALREVASVYATLRDEMIDHMVREERVLFPWLRRLESHESLHLGPPWSVKRPIDCMIHDHDSVGAAFRRLSTLTDGYAIPLGACMSYSRMLTLLRELEQDTRRHIHEENNVLFPAGVAAEQRRPRRESISGEIHV